MNLETIEIITNETDVQEIAVGSITVDNLSLNTPITTQSFVSDTTITGTLTCPSASFDELACSTLTVDTLQATTLDANAVNADTLFANSLDSTSFDSNQVSCAVLTTSTFNCQSVSSKYYETETFTTLTAEIIQENTTIDAPVRVASTFKNGTLETGVEYTVINNAPSLFSDLQLATDSTGTNTLFIYGDVLTTSESLPRIIAYNTPLGGFDNGTGYGGKIAYLSLCSASSGSPRTLRYERDGKLTLYTNTGAIFWQSTNMVSDIRDKTNIEPIFERCSDKLQDLQGYHYTYKDDPTPRIGLLAQDVERHFPEAILKPTPDAYMSIDYMKLIPVLIESLKEVATETEMYK